MRNAETILGIIRERGKRGLPLKDVYQLLYQPALYLRAYGRIYRNEGAMTAGTTAETVDGMSYRKIETLIDLLRHERYRWTPVRRVYIEKKNSTKKRPLGMPSWSDKLLQEVIRSILEAYYENQFSPTSHGFRPERGCHTALTEIHQKWNGTVWFVEGDISQCFDSLDHSVLMSILSEKIQDNRFLRLLHGLLQAGYLENWKFNITLSGVPQGGIVSPILTNIYLDKLDKYVETILQPMYNQGEKRGRNQEYMKLARLAWYHKSKGHKQRARDLRREMRKMPSMDVNDPGYRRLRYIRYADDILLGFIGPRKEAELIKQQLGGFLQETLKLELSEAKTLITHAQTQTARFLGYEIVALHDDQKRNQRGNRTINGVIGLRVPMDVVKKKAAAYKRHGKPVARTEQINDSDFDIVVRFQQVYRGIVEYYQLAYNLHRLDALRWVMQLSLGHTLARKYRCSMKRIFERYTTMTTTTEGPKRILQVVVEREGKKPLVAQWGSISLARREKAILNDFPTTFWNPRTELIQRLLAQKCELCGSQEGVEVHHVRHLRDLQQKGRKEKPSWVKVMAARRRKTLVVCLECHQSIHRGQLHSKRRTGEP